MSTLKKILCNIEGYCCVVTLAGISILVFTQVVFRYVLSSSLSWTEEVTRYLLVWTVFMGGAYCVKEKAHVGVEAFTYLLPKKARKVLAIVVMIGCVVLCSVIFKVGVDIVISLLTKMQVSPVLRIPMAYLYAAIPVGMALFIVRYIINIYEAIKDFNKEEEELSAIAAPEEYQQL